MKRSILTYIAFYFFFFGLVGNANAQQFSSTEFTCTCTQINESDGECTNAFIKNDSSCEEGYVGTVNSCLNSPARFLRELGDFQASCAEDTSEGPPGYGQFCDPNANNPCGKDANNNPIQCSFDLKSNLNKCINAESKQKGEDCVSHEECIGNNTYCDPFDFVCKGGDNKAPTCSGEYGVGFPSAVGCFPFDTIKAAVGFNVFVLGISGSIALVLLARAAFIYMTSQGDPAKIAEVKSSVTAVISGLVMIAFAVYILRFFGDTLLGLF